MPAPVTHLSVLASGDLGRRITAAARATLPGLECEVTESLDGLPAAGGSGYLLVSCGTSVIVPADRLRNFGAGAFNFHAAPPTYPGRDPHHFAAYDGATRYGATVHVMEPRVDSGAIIDVLWEDVAPDTTPAQYLAAGQRACERLLERWIPHLVLGEPVLACGEAWGERKTTRADFERLCRVTPTVDEAEFSRRLRATAHPTYNNLTVELHGWRFRLDGRVEPGTTRDWDEFTESGYTALLERALRRFRFCHFGESPDVPHVLWRHDVDLSMHRALSIARIEAALGVSATYFVMLRSAFYNLAEPMVLETLKQILALGHRLGLHFQAEALGGQSMSNGPALDAAVRQERGWLEYLTGAKVEALSFHNPTVLDPAALRPDHLGGLVNAYGAGLQRDYTYCSDSNGYWRHRPLRDVLEDPAIERLQVLTHPAWWTPQPMSPRARIERCALSRAVRAMRDYDDQLEAFGRRNIGADDI